MNDESLTRLLAMDIQNIYNTKAMWYCGSQCQVNARLVSLFHFVARDAHDKHLWLMMLNTHMAL